MLYINLDKKNLEQYFSDSDFQIAKCSPAVVSFINLKQFKPATWAAAITDLLSASVKKLGIWYFKTVIKYIGLI